MPENQGEEATSEVYRSAERSELIKGAGGRRLQRAAERQRSHTHSTPWRWRGGPRGCLGLRGGSSGDRHEHGQADFMGRSRVWRVGGVVF